VAESWDDPLAAALHAPGASQRAARRRHSALTITHDLGPHGDLDPVWDPGPPAWARVPGGSGGEQVLLLRDWEAVVHGVRHRDLRAIGRGHAMAGVTLQHDDGLLRLNDGHVREVVNHLWTAGAADRQQQAIMSLAEAHAARLRGAGRADLVADFCGPYVADVIGALAGLDGAAEACRLRELSDQTTGALLPSPAAHGPAAAAWDGPGGLYEFLRPVVARARDGYQPGLMAPTITAWDDAGLPRAAAFHAAVCAYNGFPTIAPALGRVIEQFLTRPGAVAAVRANPPAAAAAVVREAMWHAAHFTFALPGILTRPLACDGHVTARAGTPVLPVVHAAHLSRARPWSLGPGPAGLAWGAGIHACLGRHVAPLILAAAVRALAALPRLELRHIPAHWPPATMPSPPRIDAET
jgi:cytochrome P450